jgi:hypothetical protein
MVVDAVNYTYYDASGSLIKTTICDPPFPLKLLNPVVGDTFSRTYTCTTTVASTNATSSATNTKTMTIIGYESVVTPYGTFENALKYSYIYNNDTFPGYVWEVSGVGKIKEAFASSGVNASTTSYQLTSYTVH